MIDLEALMPEDVGRQVVYSDGVGDTQTGVLSSWNHEVVFVRFKGPNGEGCSPEYVSFLARSFDESYKAIREAGGDAWDAVPNVADAISEIRGVPQSVDECVELLVAVLDKLEDPTKKRDAIDDAIHRLNFERRWALLSDKQRNHMHCTSLTEGQKQALRDALAKGKKQHDALIAEYARSLYFRKAAWVAYLNGEGDPPVGE